ncbi:MAG: TerB family tellurite resistance protein [Opitutales bacterium]|nr:TerB family tellurite resistance protein [Opitutales bacterium]NRA28122.1 TerB family tellurite resistance protein [Opitutales bacterium]
MLGKFRALLGGSRIGKDGYTDTEREATVSLLVLIAFSDQTLRISEKEQIMSVMESFDWSSEIDHEQIYFAAVTRVRQALVSDRSMDVFMEDMRRSFSGEQSLKRAIKLTLNIANSDGQFSIEEASFIDHIRRLNPTLSEEIEEKKGA